MKLVNATMGSGWKEEDVDMCGAKIYNLESSSAVRDGITGEDDTLPHRIMEECLNGARSEGANIGKENFEDAVGILPIARVERKWRTYRACIIKMDCFN